jgi:hypothetical protein
MIASQGVTIFATRASAFATYFAILTIVKAMTERLPSSSIIADPHIEVGRKLGPGSSGAGLPSRQAKACPRIVRVRSLRAWPRQRLGQVGRFFPFAANIASGHLRPVSIIRTGNATPITPACMAPTRRCSHRQTSYVFSARRISPTIMAGPDDQYNRRSAKHLLPNSDSEGPRESRNLRPNARVDYPAERPAAGLDPL